MVQAYLKAIGIAIGLMLAWAMMHLVLAAPPPAGLEPYASMTQQEREDLSKWIKTLKNFPRGSGATQMQGCCDFSDCRITQVRRDEDGNYWAWIGKDRYGSDAPDAWMLIDEHAMGAVSNGPPPDGHFHVCFFGGAIQCAKGADGG